jgi:hypothetical protein
VKKAKQTLERIDEAISKDDGAAFRQNLEWLLPKMDDAYRGSSSKFRSHLGASLIGKKCSRELWYSFHWATVKKFPARIQRLFNRGHLEEARFLAMLIGAGFELWFEKEDGGQFKFSGLGGHFGSSLDGVIRGIPDLPEGAPAYAEFKTCSDKVFQKIVKKGVAEVKFEHYVQMQMCMHYMNLRHALYMVVNKNDDTLHAEVLDYDSDTVIRYQDRGHHIIHSTEPLPMIHPSPGWYECLYCDYLGICKKYEVPDINCRTCAHSTAEDGGAWSCALGHSDIINSDAAMYGCPDHIYNPTMLQGVTMMDGDASRNMIALQLPSGETVSHGPQDLTSQQLFAKGLK